MMNTLFLISYFLLPIKSIAAKPQPVDFSSYIQNAVKEFKELKQPEFFLDYHQYFSSISTLNELNKQENFFKKLQKEKLLFNTRKLTRDEKIILNHLNYVIDLNLYRISLEKNWVAKGRKIPENGLYSLKNREKWLKFFIRKFTSTNLTPEQVFNLGQNEIKKVQNEIQKIKNKLGFKDDESFYDHLQSPAFFITDKKQLLKNFQSIDTTVREKVSQMFPDISVPKLMFSEWPEAGANTPPGIYIKASQNSSGEDIFQFNFYQNRFNKRNMDWLFIHEGIPGHHFQVRFPNSLNSPVEEMISYDGGYAEGWACFIENYGNEFGLYSDVYQYLGKWQWDLVRSVRLPLEIGIHYYGWNYKQALIFWKKNIHGQDDIADREIKRVTNWPGQALTYKVGAHFIYSLKKHWEKKHPHETDGVFFRKFLELGRLPLTVAEYALQ